MRHAPSLPLSRHANRKAAGSGSAAADNITLDRAPRSLAEREDPAASLRADRTFNHLAGIWRLTLDALVPAFVAVRMILIRDRPPGYFGAAVAEFCVALKMVAPAAAPTAPRNNEHRESPAD